jgi:hypothetical protein
VQSSESFLVGRVMALVGVGMGELRIRGGRVASRVGGSTIRIMVISVWRAGEAVFRFRFICLFFDFAFVVTSCHAQRHAMLCHAAED